MKPANSNESQSRLRAHGGFGPHIFFVFFLQWTKISVGISVDKKDCGQKTFGQKTIRIAKSPGIWGLDYSGTFTHSP